MKCFSAVAFARHTGEAKTKEIQDMVDKVIRQTFPNGGLRELIRPGDKVVLKVNLVGPAMGARGEKGRGIITDPRIVRYVAELVREIIGYDNGAELIVADACMYADPNPSLKSADSGFYWARLEQTGDNSVDKQDICYDYDADGILDGESNARLVNLDSLGENERQLFKVEMPDGHHKKVAFPKFLRTREEAAQSDTPELYCDVLIGLPIFKSHGFQGITGALKLHYGIRSMFSVLGDTGRFGHSGMYYDENGLHCSHNLRDYLCAMHRVRSYDFIIMDCLTANRKGPTLPVGGVYHLANPDQKTDYILTNAVMASRDPVAIDTVEAAFAGYERESIPMLKTASQNGLGQCDPSRILLQGQELFSLHRALLLSQYGRDKYPLEDGWGGARVISDLAPRYIVDASHPKKISTDVYCIRYRIVRMAQADSFAGETCHLCAEECCCQHRPIIRVDCVVSGVHIGSIMGKDTERGEFLLDLHEHSYLRGSSLVWEIFAWDDIFNCVASIERFAID